MRANERARYRSREGSVGGVLELQPTRARYRARESSVGGVLELQPMREHDTE